MMPPSRYLAKNPAAPGKLLVVYLHPAKHLRKSGTIDEDEAEDWFADPVAFDCRLNPDPAAPTVVELESSGFTVWIWGDAAIRKVPSGNRYVIAFKTQSGDGWKTPAEYAFGGRDIYSPSIDGLALLGAKTYGRRVEARRALARRASK